MACVHVAGCFNIVGIGEFGRNVDRVMCRASRLGQWLGTGRLKAPHDNDEWPKFSYSCADEAFALKANYVPILKKCQFEKQSSVTG
jgi:hypothetical protein